MQVPRGLFILLATIGASLQLTVAAPTAAPKQNVAQASTYYLDCGSNSVTNLCSAKNSDTHCNPTTGKLTTSLAGTCGACKCIKEAVCTRGCARK
ncbi:hypothetical protein PG985_005373 [Apiospora marii]|uniref:Uncharacterized protein n=1 Tax=Apiospora marii TaxID=335849 RepID=A0ABR1SBU1_9PEZI